MSSVKEKLKVSYVITENNKRVREFDTVSEALGELSKNRYLLGYRTVTRDIDNPAADAKIEAYLDQLTDITELNTSKASRVLVSRIHNNPANRKRIALSMVYEPDSPVAAD